MTLQISRIKLILLTSLFIVFADNYRFFSQVKIIYPLSPSNTPFLLSIAVVFFSFLALFFSLFNSILTLKPILIFSVLVAAFISYFANTYCVIIDDTMIQNVLETNASESLDLISSKLFLYVFLLGGLPALLIYKVKTPVQTSRQTLASTLVTISITVLIIIVTLLCFSKFYTSFFREHKPLRYYTNPTYAFYSVGKYIGHKFDNHETELKAIGLDAKKDADAHGRRLAIVVVGEAARADRFSLNGYKKETNPLLKKEDIINFSNMYSCGTTTAISVPCMFSYLERKNYNDKKAKTTENVLDVLNRGGVKILWRDNNSSSKGVADRVSYENYRTPETNTICDSECRDVGMLNGLQDFINQQDEGDILIVLHQRGNHGPAYAKRYPQAFEKFTPVCKTNQLEECQQEEIGNAYDNAILYTDYFLQQTLELLKQNDGTFQSALFYMSDHGESLGENGLYLHGMPYFIAPDAQKHAGALMWFGASARQEIDTENLQQTTNDHFSHDNLFHTLLGFMRIKTSLYNEEKDILKYF
ncbi:phosphatidylethanolamine:Kdo2-lipid A phosphoethanolamine transferase [Desulfuromusa kysingii]|uniref:Phosphatidylethanolamine:Kdo2-lipid A phosphoethanolamine transferase n=1 Tax=Desulfuromusa kysingii TaxID=37625 RepID=A0A1H4ATH2_9BACT|nr:phosphoethanolamine--lipid A transferase [Desulfuromusa kysingii]SEA39067.1 phosphatidylethanolamine:Kdo2-lipid A phosphoethanolamine transferase [Desulfuromusa kysingii]